MTFFRFFCRPSFLLAVLNHYAKKLPSDLKIVQACTQFAMGRNPLKLKKHSYKCIYRRLLSVEVRQFS